MKKKISKEIKPESLFKKKLAAVGIVGTGGNSILLNF